MLKIGLNVSYEYLMFRWSGVLDQNEMIDISFITGGHTHVGLVGQLVLFYVATYLDKSKDGCPSLFVALSSLFVL